MVRHGTVPKSAVATALSLLSRGPKTKSELNKRLLLKGFEQDAISSAIVELEKAGYVDDAKYAMLYAASMAKRQRGPQKIIFALKTKGVNESAIKEAVSGLLVDEGATAHAALSKWLRAKGLSKKDLTDRKNLAKAYRFLSSRGFGAKAVSIALGKNLEDC